MDRQDASSSVSAAWVEARLAEFIERREAGELLGAEEFAQEFADHERPSLLRAVEMLEQTERVLPSGGLPQRIGPFKVLGEIGRGGMGRVLRVQRQVDGQTQELALKLLHLNLIGEERSLERFRREGAALAELHHPGVVSIMETGVSDGAPYLAMELVQGDSLAEHLQRARSSNNAGSEQAPIELPGVGDPWQRIARLVAAAARAVGAAHAKGVLHRDIKPRNVIVQPGGDPVLIDFGLVRAQDTPTLTGSGDMIGTPQYMAPEQARGERCDEGADIWGLGALLFELITKQPPRSGDDAMQALNQARSLPVPSVRRSCPTCPRALAQICSRAMTLRRPWRYASADSMAAELERFARGEALAEGSLRPIVRVHEIWARHRRALALGLILTLTGLAIWMARTRPEPISAEEKTRRAAASFATATTHWLDGELDAMRPAVDEMARWNPKDIALDFMRELAHGRLLVDSDVPAIRALIRAEGLRLGGKPGEAMRAYEEVLNLAPPAPIILAMIGLAAMQVGEIDRARWAFEAIARDLFESRVLHTTLGEIYWISELYDDANLAWSTARTLDPDNVDLLTKLCNAKLRVGLPEEAREVAATLLELGPAGKAAVANIAATEERAGRSQGAGILKSLLDAADSESGSRSE